MSVDYNRLQFERIRNLVRGFGWDITKEEITDDALVMTLSRKRVVPVEGTEGAPAA